MNLLGNLLAPRTSKSRRRTNQGMHDTEEAIMRSEVNATILARQELMSAVLVTAKRLQYLDSSDIWAILPFWSGGNPSVLGSVMRQAVKEGYITPLKGVYMLSRKKSAHRRPVQRYQSNICRRK